MHHLLAAFCTITTTLSLPTLQIGVMVIQLLNTIKASYSQPVNAKSKVNSASYVLGVQKSPETPCHASMMLPGTYWALVESILYSSWYLDTVSMDTDRYRLGESGIKEAGKGRRGEGARKGCHSGCLCSFLFFFFFFKLHHLHLETESNHFLTLGKNMNTVCAARRTKMESDTWCKLVVGMGDLTEK